jgi:two-component system chemotaxis sensor kinase CheA
MKIDMAQFRATFFEEAAEHLASLEEGLLRLEDAPQDLELLNSIFRAAHSIKGASSTFGFADVAKFTHGMEGLLDRLRDGQMIATSQLIESLLRGADMLTLLIAAAKEGSSETPETQAVEAEIMAWLGQTPVTATATATGAALPTATERDYEIRFAPHANIFACGMDPLLLVRELGTLGTLHSTTLDSSRLPTFSAFDPCQCYLAWTLQLTTSASRGQIEDVFMFVSDDSDLTIREIVAEDTGKQAAKPDEVAVSTAAMAPDGKERSTKKAVSSESIRVSVEKVEELINLVGELVIANSMVNQAISTVPSEQALLLREAVAIMERTTRELQTQVMGVRMVPMANVFNRFPRIVRDLSQSLHKKVRVDIVGEETELDKQVVEAIGDPLTHLIRNAVDHGIEVPQQRLESGKSEEGHLTLTAAHEGGKVMIDIEDDGRGLDVERIRAKAIQQGVITEDSGLSPEQIQQLIFHPGLSTAEKVTDVSGRGVGMDVVKRNIEALNGSVSIQSQVGKGTRFRIALPLTMAILDGLSVSLADEVYILPLLSVVESLRPQPQDIKTVQGRGEVIMVRGEALPLVRLHRAFGVEPQFEDPCQALVVIIENQDKKFGLLVDSLLGQLQVVMKSLEANYHKVDGVSGATILGDGTVAFILDIAALQHLAT